MPNSRFSDVSEEDLSAGMPLPPLNKRSFATSFVSFSLRSVLIAALLGAAATVADALLLAGIRGGVLLLAAEEEVEWWGWVFRADLRTALIWSVALLGVILLRFVIGIFRWQRVARHSALYERDVRLSLVQAPPPRGEVERHAHRFTNDIGYLRRGGEHLHQFIQALLQLLVFVPWMAMLSIELTVLMLLVLAPVISLLQRRLHKVGVPIGAVMSRVDRLGRDYEGWLRLGISWTLPAPMIAVKDHIRTQIDDLSDSVWRIEAQRARLVGAAELVSGVATLLVLVGSGMLLRTGSLSIADLIAFCGALLLCYRPLREGFRLPPVLRDAQVAWERLRSMASIPPAPEREYSSDNTFVLDRVSFAYGTRMVLGNAECRLPMDRPMVLHGPNGSGKSTLLKLIAGLLLPRTGRILLPHQCRGRDIAYLSQDPILPRWIPLVFRDGEERELLEALRLPQHTGSGEGVLELNASGGELQRMALAAILLQESKWVVLDEPVAKIPYEERGEIMEAIRTYCAAKGRFLLVASHEELAGFHPVRMQQIRGYV